MSPQRFALIDPAAGISGDMLLGALIDLGAPPAWLRGLPARLGAPNVEVDIADVMRCGMRSTKVTVRLNGATEGPGDVNHTHEHPQHHHADGHHHHSGTDHHHAPGSHAHRHVGELLGMIQAADLSPWTKERATAAFRLLAEAEGRIHGVAPESVSLHEVGAFDALVDIVGAVEGFEQLGIVDIRTRPVALGSGWVRAAHGLLPVPAPATAILVEGLAIAADGPIVGEATTPTGAALLRALVSRSEPLGQWAAVRTGWGAGGRDPAGYANTLRVVIGEAVAHPDEVVTIIATDLDDLSPEYLEPLRAALVTAGALDVQSWPTQMKKGRTGFRVEALATADRIGSVTTAFFKNSTTAGVRRWAAERSTLPRHHWVLQTDDGQQFRIKTTEGPQGPHVKPEFDDVLAAAERTGQPAHQLFRMIQAQALRAETSAIATTKESTR